MVTPLVKTTKIKKKPNGFTRYQSDTAKRVSVRLFYSRITTTLVVGFLPRKRNVETERGLFICGEEKRAFATRKRGISRRKRMK